jgi:hypothetical protein
MKKPLFKFFKISQKLRLQSRIPWAAFHRFRMIIMCKVIDKSLFFNDLKCC